MKKTILNKIVILFSVFFLISCNLFNKEEQEPIYVTVNEVYGQNQDRATSKSHNIVDVWVSTKEQSAGAHTIPTTFPVLHNDEDLLILDAGIYVNGFTYQREKYFFYKSFVDTISVNTDENISVTPKFEYLTNTIFSEQGSDNFESTVRKFKSEHDTRLIKYVADESSFEGQSAYLVNNEGDNLSLGMITKIPFKIDNDKVNAPVFLEFDFKSNRIVEIWLKATLDGQTDELNIINLNDTKDEWKHLYIDLIDEVNNSDRDINWELNFKADSTDIDEYFAFDNIRLLYLE